MYHRPSFSCSVTGTLSTLSFFQFFRKYYSVRTLLQAIHRDHSSLGHKWHPLYYIQPPFPSPLPTWSVNSIWHRWLHLPLWITLSSLVLQKNLPVFLKLRHLRMLLILHLFCQSKSEGQSWLNRCHCMRTQGGKELLIASFGDYGTDLRSTQVDEGVKR